MINVYTVLNVSFNHTKEYVYRLKASLERNSTLAFNFSCLTNEQLPGINTVPIEEFGSWAKMELCDSSVSGKIIYLDLDTVLIGNIDFLLKEESSFMCRSVTGTRRTQIFSLDEDQRKEIWEFWKQKRNSVIENFKGEGSVYDFILDKNILNIQEIHPGKVLDFEEAKEFIPIGSKIVTFSGDNHPKSLQEDHHIKKYW